MEQWRAAYTRHIKPRVARCQPLFNLSAAVALRFPLIWSKGPHSKPLKAAPEHSSPHHTVLLTVYGVYSLYCMFFLPWSLPFCVYITVKQCKRFRIQSTIFFSRLSKLQRSRNRCPSFAGADLQPHVFQIRLWVLARGSRAISFHRLPQLTARNPHLRWGKINFCIVSTCMTKWKLNNLLRITCWMHFKNTVMCFESHVKIERNPQMSQCGWCFSVLLSLVCSRSACLDSAQTSMETGTTTGRRTIWLEHFDTRESMMEITNIMSPCCWQTSTKSECLKADDTQPICAVGRPPNVHSSFSSRRRTVFFFFIMISKDILTWTRRRVFSSSLELLFKRRRSCSDRSFRLRAIDETEATLPLVSGSVIPTRICLGANRREDERRCLVDKHATHEKKTKKALLLLSIIICLLTAVVRQSAVIPLLMCRQGRSVS